MTEKLLPKLFCFKLNTICQIQNLLPFEEPYCTLYFTGVLYTVHCTVQVFNTLYTVLYRCLVHCTVYTVLYRCLVHCTVQVFGTLYTVLYRCLVHCTLYCTGVWYTLHCTVQVFGTLYMNEGLDKQLAVDRAVKVFSDLDIDGDGDITEVTIPVMRIRSYFFRSRIRS